MVTSRGSLVVRSSVTIDYPMVHFSNVRKFCPTYVTFKRIKFNTLNNDMSPCIKVCLILLDRTKECARVHRSDIYPDPVVEPPKKNKSLMERFLDPCMIFRVFCTVIVTHLLVGSPADKQLKYYTIKTFVGAFFTAVGVGMKVVIKDLNDNMKRNISANGEAKKNT